MRLKQPSKAFTRMPVDANGELRAFPQPGDTKRICELVKGDQFSLPGTMVERQVISIVDDVITCRHINFRNYPSEKLFLSVKSRQIVNVLGFGF